MLAVEGLKFSKIGDLSCIGHSGKIFEMDLSVFWFLGGNKFQLQMMAGFEGLLVLVEVTGKKIKLPVNKNKLSLLLGNSSLPGNEDLAPLIQRLAGNRPFLKKIHDLDVPRVLSYSQFRALLSG